MVKDDGLNLFINNAGYGSGQTLHELTSEEMRQNYEVNCVAPLMLTKVGSVCQPRSLDVPVLQGYQYLCYLTAILSDILIFGYIKLTNILLHCTQLVF